MFPSNASNLREEIAAAAARLIAEDGLDYAGAKRRAAREVLGDTEAHRDCLPDNDQVEAAVREHQALFMSGSQPGRLHALRLVARDVMRFLADAGLGTPFVTGAIVKGTAGEHSDVHLQVFDDNAKDIEIHLLNAGIDFEVSEARGSRANDEMLSFLWPPRAQRGQPQEAVHLSVLDPRDQRHSRGERADLRSLDALIDAFANRHGVQASITTDRVQSSR